MKEKSPAALIGIRMVIEQKLIIAIKINVGHRTFASLFWIDDG